jgi:hypothetical protein
MTAETTNIWAHESNWLCTIEMIPHDPEGRASSAINIGHLMGYAIKTNTRMLALVGDPMVPTYELLFSFASPEDRIQFLALVSENEDLRMDEWGDNGFATPSSEEIADARPIQEILTQDILEQVMLVAASLCLEVSPPYVD